MSVRRSPIWVHVAVLNNWVCPLEMKWRSGLVDAHHVKRLGAR